MARHLDLEEQEQLDEIKHFWKQYGNLIVWALIIGFGAVAAWNGWNWWQRSQAAQAAVLYDEVERAAEVPDVQRVERAFNDIRDKYGRTVYAQQAGLLAASTFVEKSNHDAARAALAWVAEKARDDGYRAIARLRLAGLLADNKAYDEALKQLAADLPKQFQALAADRRGDILQLQGKKAEARAEYIKAWQQMEAGAEYGRLLEVKLTALGVDTKALQSSAPATTAASGAAKS